MLLLLLPLLLLLLLLYPDFVRGLTKFIAFYKHITNAQPARTELFPLCPFVLGSSIPSSHIKARHVRWLSVGCPYVRIVRIVRIVRSPAPLEPLLGLLSWLPNWCRLCGASRAAADSAFGHGHGEGAVKIDGPLNCSLCGYSLDFLAAPSSSFCLTIWITHCSFLLQFIVIVGGMVWYGVAWLQFWCRAIAIAIFLSHSLWQDVFLARFFMSSRVSFFWASMVGHISSIFT